MTQVSHSQSTEDSPRPTPNIFVGIDVGASRTKVAILDYEKNLIGHAVKKPGTDFSNSAEACLSASLKMAHSSKRDIVSAVSTGYGGRTFLLRKRLKPKSVATQWVVTLIFQLPSPSLISGVRITRLSSSMRKVAASVSR